MEATEEASNTENEDRGQRSPRVRPRARPPRAPSAKRLQAHEVQSDGIQQQVRFANGVVMGIVRRPFAATEHGGPVVQAEELSRRGTTSTRPCRKGRRLQVLKPSLHLQGPPKGTLGLVYALYTTPQTGIVKYVEPQALGDSARRAPLDHHSNATKGLPQ